MWYYTVNVYFGIFGVHTKKEENVKLDKSLSYLIWCRIEIEVYI